MEGVHPNPLTFSNFQETLQNPIWDVSYDFDEQSVLSFQGHPQQIKIDQLAFSIFGEDEIRKRSVVEVCETKLYDKNLPKLNGINDHRMGTVDRRYECGTCGNNVEHCAGHYGHIELGLPVYHGCFIVQIEKLLKSVCYFCSSLLIPRKIVNKKGITVVNPKLAAELLNTPNGGLSRFLVITKLGASYWKKPCHNCGGYQPEYKKEDGLKIITHWDWNREVRVENSTNSKSSRSATKVPLLELVQLEERNFCERTFTPAIALLIFKRIKRQDLKLLGFLEDMHPENFIITALLVPPPAMRPSISATHGSRSKGQDDLTKKLQKIVKFSNQLKVLIEKHEFKFTNNIPQEINDILDQLQYHTATYMNNDIRDVPTDTQRSGLPVRSITLRLKGKKGRFRGNLSGKRTDFSSRTVISPDPKINLEQVGVPYHVARRLTRPDVVTRMNIKQLEKRIEKGPLHIDGAISVKKHRSGKVISLEYAIQTITNQDGSTRNIYVKPSIKLEYGDVVNRPLKDDDYVLFNRQPSLHQQSVMGHRVKRMPGRTFRLNPVCTTPYNADFDGDEMNVHVPQSIEACAEIEHIMSVPHQMLNASANKPTMGLIQDATLGAYLMTRMNTFFTKYEAVQLLMQVEHGFYIRKGYSVTKHENPILPTPAIMKPKKLWTGKQIFQTIIPDIHVLRAVRGYDDETNPFDPQERLLCIQFGEIICGALCKNTIGAKVGSIVHIIAKDISMVSSCNFLSDAQRMANTFLETYGFSVGISDCITTPSQKIEIRQIIDEAFEKIERVNKHIAQDNNSTITYADVESDVTQVVTQILDSAGRTVKKTITDNDHISTMVTAGSKGTPINLSQIKTCVGQQMVLGTRVKPNDAQPFQCFPPNSRNPAAHGFIEHSYVDGLTPQEFFTHNMAGREGLVDTSVKTSTSGYAQRRLIKSMETLKTHYDYSVRNAEGYIIQFRYGLDGFDARFLERCTLKFLYYNDEKMFKDYGIIEDSNIDAVSNSILFTESQTLIDIRDEIRRIKTSLYESDPSSVVYLPVHIRRQIARVYSKSFDTNTVLDIPTIHSMVYTFADNFDNNIFLKASILSNLSSRKVYEMGISEEGLKWIICQSMNVIEKAKITPHEMVGALASESVGEQCTQLTLNSFHFAGVLSKNVIHGVPRMTELLSIAKNIKTPSLSVFLNPTFSHSKKAAESFCHVLTETRLKDVTSNTRVLYEPNYNSTEIVEDQLLVDIHTSFFEPDEQFSEWSVRIELKRSKMEKMNLSPVHLACILKNIVGDLFWIIYSDVNMPTWILRLRSKYSYQKALSFHPDNDENRKSLDCQISRIAVERLLKQISLGGIPGIKSASVRDVPRIEYAQDGSVERKIEYMIDTEGHSLLETMLQPFVDWRRTISNDVREMAEIFGIETACYILFNEIKGVLSYDGSYINPRHILLIADLMTFRGYLMPITRHGINRIDTGVLAKASFEETIDMITEAAAFSGKDALNGVTENVIVGQLVPMGTGSCHIRTSRQSLKRLNDNDDDDDGPPQKRVKVLRSRITTWESPKNSKKHLDLYHEEVPQQLGFNFVTRNNESHFFSVQSPIAKKRKQKHEGTTLFDYSDDEDSADDNIDGFNIAAPPPGALSPTDSRVSTNSAQRSNYSLMSLSPLRSPTMIYNKEYRPSSPILDNTLCFDGPALESLLGSLEEFLPTRQT